MISRLTLVTAPGTDPYENLAREELLLSLLAPGELVLYLWQNARTVVIGRNQNCFAECRVDLLEREGGRLARRLSGGGAVYHDLDNLNYTLLARRQDFDVARQTGVLLDAVRALGVPAQRSGRNDLTAGERKFSGSAYYLTRDGCYQHGTLLLAVDAAPMERYLSPSPAKLAAKGVASVRARVCGLREFVPALDTAALAAALRAAAEREYGLAAAPPAPGRQDPAALAAKREKYASPAWKYGEQRQFSCALTRRFDWGELELGLEIAGGRIAACGVFTDALDTEFAAALRAALTGCGFAGAPLRAALAPRDADTPAAAQMRADALALLLTAV